MYNDVYVLLCFFAEEIKLLINILFVRLFHFGGAFFYEFFNRFNKLKKYSNEKCKTVGLSHFGRESR